MPDHHPTPRRFRSLTSILILLAPLLLPGCTSLLTDMIVQAPNHGQTIDDFPPHSDACLHLMGVDRQLRVDVGPPSASLMCWIIEPKTNQPSRGTVLVLHGVADGPFWMLAKAKAVSNAGFRAVLVALRGYGQSTGDYRTFGVVEKRDLSQVIDALQREKLCGDRVGVWGMSYGAHVALNFAGHDPRVKAVVSAAAFSSLRVAVPHFSRVMPPWLGLFMSDEEGNAIIDQAALEAGFNADEADAALAIKKAKAAVLLVHGTWDAIVPYANALRLYEAGDPSRTELFPMPLVGHITLWMDVDGKVARTAVAWFEKWLDPRRNSSP